MWSAARLAALNKKGRFVTKAKRCMIISTNQVLGTGEHVKGTNR